MKTFSLFVTFLGTLFTTQLSAQQISGRVTEEGSKGLQYANVVMLNATDSSFVAGAVSDEQGNYLIEGPANGIVKDKLIRVSMIGYVTRFASAQTQMPDLQLEQDSQLLGEVEVTSNLPRLQMKGDAMVAHVQGSLLEKAGTAEQMLDKIPSVQSRDGDVQVFGRGAAEIYVNGRKLQNNDELKRILSTDVQSVEVINNPGARYQASTRAVIRIRTKRPQGEGFSFSDRAEVGYKYDWSYSDQFDANYRKGGFDLGGRLSYGHTANGAEQETNQDTYTTMVGKSMHYRQESESRSRTEQDKLNAMLQANYVKDDNSAFGFRYEFERMPKNHSEMTFPTNVFLNGKDFEKSNNDISGEGDGFSHSANIYYNGKVRDWDITWNADGFWNRINSNTVSSEFITPLAYELATSPERKVESSTVYKNQMLATKLVLEHNLWGGRVGFGGEYSGNIRRNNYVGAQGITNDDQSRVNEQISSVFGEYSRRFGRFDTKFGLRYEYVNSDYYLFGKRQDEQSRTYGDLFPSFSISTVFAQKVWTQLSLSSDITRPNYSYLNSSVVYVNRYTYSGGNPLLRPTYSRNAVVNVSYKTLFASVGYQRIKDEISILMKPYEGMDGVNKETASNMPDYNHLYLVLSYQPQISKVWHPMFAMNAGYQDFEMECCDGLKKFDRPLLNLIWQNNFSLPAGFSFDANLIFIPKGDKLNVEMGNICINNFQLQRDFLKGRLNVMLSANDPFQLGKIKAKVYSGNNVLETRNIPTREFRLSATYRFNQTRDKYRGTGAGASQKSRM